MPSRLRRACDAFLRLVTPPHRYGPPIGLADRYDEPQADLPAAGGGDGDGYGLLLARQGRLDLDSCRRLGYWPGQEHRPDFARAWKEQDGDLERPWNFRWDRLPKRSAGPGFSREEYRAARARGREICQATLGQALWQQLERDGYLELPSQRLPGVSYRLRPGRRIEVRCEPGVRSPWLYDFLCINPAYPLPEYEFLAQLYLYVRDQEHEVITVAAPQPWDQALGRTF